MRRSPYPVSRVAMVAALLVALVSVSAYAQYQTGSIYGRTLSTDGSLLPGVTVTLTGVGAPQVTVSDSQGNFRYPNLSPGTYQVKAELAGFGSATHSGVRVSVGGSTDVDVKLNPTVAEAITVTGAAPLLDVRKTGTGSTIDRVEMEKIPTARDPWMILQSTPGVFVDRINVGGTQSGQQSIYISKGAPRNDGTWNIDGVNITDMGATGSSPTYYDFDTFEELQITTGGSDPRIQTSGVQLNMVTKRGTNDFKGSGRYLYAPGSTSDEATVPSEATGYLFRTNRVNYVRDYGADIGGPLWRDRAWLWLARGDQKISTWQAQAPGQVIIPDDTILRNKNAKLNAQPFGSNSFVAAYTYGDKYRNARDLSTTRPFAASWKQTGPTEVYKLEDTQMFGPNFFATAMWSKVKGGFGLFANGGEGETAKPYWVDKDGVFNDGYFTYQTVRPQKQYRLDGSTFHNLMGRSHELKFGFGYRDTPVESITTYPGPSSGFWSYSTTANSTTICANQGLPANCGIATLVRSPQAAYSGEYSEIYVGDTVLLGNLTLQAGFRYDNQQSRIETMNVGANPVLSTPLNLPCISTLNCTSTGGSLNASLPGISYPGQNETLEWKSVAPRIGATYALGTTNRTLLRAAYNRYVSQLGSSVATSSPLSYSAFTFYGVDTNGDRVISRDELSKVRSFTGINPAAPSAVGGTRRIDYDMNPPTTDELLFGAERELWSGFSVGLTFTHRRTKDLVAVLFEKTQGGGDFYTANDYVLSGRNAGGTTFTLRDPVTGAEITSFPTSSVPVWALKADVPTPLFSVITNRPDYKQTYNGVELTATKQMSRNWMMRVNASYNDYTDDCGSGAAANPTPGLNSTGIVNGAAVFAGPPTCPGGQIAPQSAGSGAFGNVFINSKWNANMSGLYVAPWGINIGANFMARQGYPAVLRDTVTGLRGGTVTAVLDPIGEIRFPNVYQLDLRIAKDFRFFDRAGVTLAAEVFNATNQRTILQRNTSILQNGTPLSSGWRITEIQAPRVWRIGARFNF